MKTNTATQAGEVQKYRPPDVAGLPANLDDQLRFADTLIKSGFLPAHIKTPAQVVAIVMRGRELGLPAMEAVTSLYIARGKVTCDTKTMLALALRAGVVEPPVIKESTDERCVITVARNGGKPQEFTFTIKDASNLGLAAKDNYRQQPRVMLRWRCIAEALRVVAPDAISGLYTHEEMGLPVCVTSVNGQPEDIELDSKALETEREPGDDSAEVNAEEAKTLAEVDTHADEIFPDDKPPAHLISEPQRKRLFQIAKEAGVTHEQVKAILKERFNCDSTKSIEVAWYDDVCEAIHKKGQAK